MIKKLLIALLAATVATPAYAQPVVLELFTSQGCSSCPPADALLAKLAQSPDVLALSFHVHYWDYLGWRDPFASPDNTQRQHSYAAALHQRGVFTPQLIAGGAYSAVGNSDYEVNRAILEARSAMQPTELTLAAKYNTLHIHVGKGQQTAAGVYAVTYKRNASTQVLAGENGGHTLTSINNVTSVSKLGTWQGTTSDYTLPLVPSPDDGIAVLVQEENHGHIVTAASYTY